MCRLPDLATSKISLSVDPADAVGDVEAVGVWVQQRPFWGLSLPLPPARGITMPVVARLPKGLPARAVCQVFPPAPWDVIQAQLDFSTDQDQTYTFQLSPRASPPAPQAATSEVFSVRTLTPAGDEAPAMAPTPYDAASQLGIDDARTRGVTFERNEAGADFVVEHSDRAREAAAQMVRGWAETIRQASPPDTAVLSIMRGAIAPAEAPNVRLLPPPGGMAALVGALGHRPVLWVGRPGEVDGQQVRPHQIGQGMTLRVAPGPVRFRLKLPWGRGRAPVSPRTRESCGWSCQRRSAAPRYGSPCTRSLCPSASAPRGSLT